MQGITQQCTICKRELPLTEFYKNSRTKSGYLYQCKKCWYKVQYHHEKPEVKICPICHISFPKEYNKSYCSDKCRETGFQETHKRASSNTRYKRKLLAFEEAYKRLNCMLSIEMKKDCFEKFLKWRSDGVPNDIMAERFLYEYSKQSCKYKIPYSQLSVPLYRGAHSQQKVLEYLSISEKCTLPNLCIKYIRLFCKQYPQFIIVQQYAEDSIKQISSILKGYNPITIAGALVFYFAFQNGISLQRKEYCKLWKDMHLGFTDTTLRTNLRKIKECYT